MYSDVIYRKRNFTLTSKRAEHRIDVTKGTFKPNTHSAALAADCCFFCVVRLSMKFIQTHTFSPVLIHVPFLFRLVVVFSCSLCMCVLHLNPFRSILFARGTELLRESSSMKFQNVVSLRISYVISDVLFCTVLCCVVLCWSMRIVCSI